LENGRKSARNAAFFQLAAQQREPVHAGFSRFGEHSLCAKQKRFASAPERALGGVRPTIASPGDGRLNFDRSGLFSEKRHHFGATENHTLFDAESITSRGPFERQIHSAEERLAIELCGSPLRTTEPRWQAILAMAAVGGVYLDLPRELVIGPTWLLLTVIAVLLAPTIVTYRIRRHSFSHSLGIVNNGTITVALIGSVSLLVGTLASHKEPPLRLLRSGAELWLTNVLVFSLGNRLRVAAFNVRRRGGTQR
jgi:hypothetical protein